jgi:hypothetical protein
VVIKHITHIFQLGVAFKIASSCHYLRRLRNTGLGLYASRGLSNIYGILTREGMKCELDLG